LKRHIRETRTTIAGQLSSRESGHANVVFYVESAWNSPAILLITAAESKAARELLGWLRPRLSARAAVSDLTVQKFE
jgi:hypothetical protein